MSTTPEKARVGYRRDRSFYDSRPNTARTPKIHRESVTRVGMAACDGVMTMLDTDAPVPLDGSAEQLTMLCLRCFPLNQPHLYRPGVSTGDQ